MLPRSHLSEPGGLGREPAARLTRSPMILPKIDRTTDQLIQYRTPTADRRASCTCASPRGRRARYRRCGARILSPARSRSRPGAIRWWRRGPHKIIEPSDPEDSQREAEAAEQETGVAERDDESIPPSQRLEELYLLNGGSSQASSLLIFAAHRVPQSERPRARGLMGAVIPVCTNWVNEE